MQQGDEEDFCCPSSCSSLLLGGGGGGGGGGDRGDDSYFGLDDMYLGGFSQDDLEVLSGLEGMMGDEMAALCMSAPLNPVQLMGAEASMTLSPASSYCSSSSSSSSSVLGGRKDDSYCFPLLPSGAARFVKPEAIVVADPAALLVPVLPVAPAAAQAQAKQPAKRHPPPNNNNNVASRPAGAASATRRSRDPPSDEVLSLRLHPDTAQKDAQCKASQIVEEYKKRAACKRNSDYDIGAGAPAVNPLRKKRSRSSSFSSTSSSGSETVPLPSPVPVPATSTSTGAPPLQTKSSPCRAGSVPSTWMEVRRLLQGGKSTARNTCMMVDPGCPATAASRGVSSDALALDLREDRSVFGLQVRSAEAHSSCVATYTFTVESCNLRHTFKRTWEDMSMLFCAAGVALQPKQLLDCCEVAKYMWDLMSSEGALRLAAVRRFLELEWVDGTRGGADSHPAMRRLARQISSGKGLSGGGAAATEPLSITNQILLYASMLRA
jgi:hypothetical protein